MDKTKQNKTEESQITQDTLGS